MSNSPDITDCLDAGFNPFAYYRKPPQVCNPPFRMCLSSLVSTNVMANIEAKGSVIFHAVGDTCGHDGRYRGMVAQCMEAQCHTADSFPSFFLHLGDVIQPNGRLGQYNEQFFNYWKEYPSPIIAIPGNHDGDTPVNEEDRSLSEFALSFCNVASSAPSLSYPHNGKAKQPNVYWALEMPFSTILGIYTNVTAGGCIDSDQQAWLEEQLAAVPPKHKLILAMHHSIYSCDEKHGGSSTLLKSLVRATEISNRVPDLVLSGHSHNYQRFTTAGDGLTNDKTLRSVYVVAGAGGQKLHKLRHRFSNANLPLKLKGGNVTLQSYNDSNYGFLQLEAGSGFIRGTYYAIFLLENNAVRAVPWDTFEA